MTGGAGHCVAAGRATAIAARQCQRQRCREQQDAIAKLRHLVVVVELGDELVALPLIPGLLELELEPLPLVPGPPIELVLPLLPGDELLLVVSLLLLPLLLGVVLAVLGLLLVLLLLEPGLVLAVLGLVGEVLLDELEPGVVPAPDVLCLLQALSERAATTAKVAVAH
jgi:hypothetical protein